jgi:two-component system, OmpR family, response regulator RegX3
MREAAQFTSVRLPSLNERRERALRIAILEDDPDQLALLSRWIVNAGHQVHGYLRGNEVLKNAARESFDLFVLDWEVPDISGVEVLRWIRSNLSASVPVLFVTVRDTEEDIVHALNSGADDYMIKPVRQSETQARLGALLRRAYPQKETTHLVIPPYEFDTQAGIARLNGTPVTLTPKEFELAVLLFRNVDRLMSRGHLQEMVWGRGVDLPTRSVDTHVSQVRKKLGLRGEHGFRAAAIYNYGYRLKRIPEGAAKTPPPV